MKGGAMRQHRLSSETELRTVARLRGELATGSVTLHGWLACMAYLKMDEMVDARDTIRVTCGEKEADFCLSKMGKGNRTGKCVFFNNRWITPSEFETAAGIQPGRKWKKSIKYKGKPIEEWLDANGPKSSIACDYSKDPFSLSEAFSQELDENPDTELQMSEGQGDIQPTQKQAMSGSLYTVVQM